MAVSSPRDGIGRQLRPLATPRALLLVALVGYVALTLDHLSVFPPVGEDEPWIAAAPYKLATTGVYGSDLFTGYYGVERHNYQHMPVYPLLQALTFKALGVGVWQMRLLPAVFGLALLLAVALVGTRVADARVGALAALLMIGLTLSSGDGGTGVLLLDRARINRYDIAVPVFGLLAFWAFLEGRRSRHPVAWHLLTGMLAGLSSLSHLFGIFWLPCLVALALTGPRGSVPRLYLAGLVVLGFLLPWIPWLAYVASGWDDFLGQMRFVSSRFELLDPTFYASNLLRGGGPVSFDWLWQTIGALPAARPGAWCAILGIPLALGAWAWGTRGGAAGHVEAWMLGAVSVAQLVMFGLLLKVKTINYMIGLWPLAVLLLAWAGVRFWDRRQRVLQAGLLLLLVAVLAEAATRVAQAAAAARRATPYDTYTSEVARCIPEGSRVLGLQHYWLGLRQFQYRTWLLAVNRAHPLYHHAPIPLDRSIEEIDPDIVLIDRYMARFFEDAANVEHPLHQMRVGFDAFMARRHAVPVCGIRDETYGTMIVYRVPHLTS